jgi:thiol-disulfide isomerase/thioredoxin
VAGLILVAWIAIRIVVARSFDNGPMPPPLAKSGQLEVMLPDGSRRRLGDLVRPGVPTVINLWASWCGPCVEEGPKIAELRRRFGPRQLNIVSLNVRDEISDREAKALFMKDAGLAPEAYAILANDKIRALANTEDVLIPRTIVFDSAGAPLARITGYKPLALDRVAGLIGN